MDEISKKKEIHEAVKHFQTWSNKRASLHLLRTLGYQSERTLEELDGTPLSFFQNIVEPQMQKQGGEASLFSKEKALFHEWDEVHLLFQLSDQELSLDQTLFKDPFQTGIFESYVFFVIRLKKNVYSRHVLATITRQINRLFPMPVMVFFVYGQKVSIAVIQRRVHKLRSEKDVLGKVTLVHAIDTMQPHRGHIDILFSLSTHALQERKKKVTSFDLLHQAWEEIFNIELLNKTFYDELSDWFFWARKHVRFPADLEPDEDTRNSVSVIRLLTRIIFCWFLKEKNLIPDALFQKEEMASYLSSFDEEEDTYYKAILQNLFFATLNQKMNTPHEKNNRFFAEESHEKEKSKQIKENRDHYGIKSLYRYKKLFQDETKALALFEEIPFLNGGLFTCLDLEDENRKVRYADGFSRNPAKQAYVPNFLFFGSEREVDLSEDYGEKKKKKAHVKGLFHLFQNYKFTLTENTPIEQEVALDPELLGKVFENLLASYNPETGSTARKETGSFYTRRTLVDAIVDDSLQSYFQKALQEKFGPKKKAFFEKNVHLLLSYTEEAHSFEEKEIQALISSIHRCKILDPACGSGAFPMGVLHKLVHVLSKLDPNNEKWKQVQIEKLDSPSMREELEKIFKENNDDYGRKLYLIENCIYGVDIQPIAIQISKLRFFITLLCDQQVKRDPTTNHGLRPLPNLETKFVAADTLIRLFEEASKEAEEKLQRELFADPKVQELQEKLGGIRHRHFSAQDRDRKQMLQKEDDALRKELSTLLVKNLGAKQEDAKKIAAWDPYHAYDAADFFEPAWMFGADVAKGFDLVLGNPPYVQIQKFSKEQKKIWVAQKFKTYEATGDIYCLFYERGVQLLKDGGSLCYITSNKWMRADYGEPLRSFLSATVDTHRVLDFGMAQNFGAATTYTCIVSLSKTSPTHQTQGCYATNDRAAMDNPLLYFQANSIALPDVSFGPWVVLSQTRQRIKAEVENQGTPLQKWKLKIVRGVLTGLNDAFYITQAQRDAFVEADPRCADFLVPLLRGRQVERYRVAWDGTWMIATFPSLNLSLSQLPKPLLKHLTLFRPSLEPKPEGWKGASWEGRKAGSYNWFETQDTIAYHEDFSKPKILYQEIAQKLPFYFDEDQNFFTNDTCYILVSEIESLETLTAIFNSSVFRFCFKDNFPENAGHAYRVKKTFFEKIPIKKPTEKESRLFGSLVRLVQRAKKETRAEMEVIGLFLEKVIDMCVMEMYFAGHMKERKLAITEEVIKALEGYKASETEEKQDEFLVSFYRTANDPKNPIRNGLLRLATDSPDLLGVIEKEGEV